MSPERIHSIPPNVRQALESANSVLLCGHEQPDGDVLGSQAGLYHLLRRMGKSVRIVNPDMPGRSFDFLQEHTPFEAYERGVPLERFDLVVLLDCSEFRRLRALGETLLTLGSPVLVVDHHVGSEHGDGDLAFVDSTAAATGEMVFRLYDGFAIEPGRDAAEGLFTAFVADTGWFRYSNTDASVFDRAAALMRTGLSTERIDTLLNRRADPGSVDVLASALSGCRLELDGRFGTLVLTKDKIERAVRVGLELDRAMEPLRSVDGIEVVALLKEQDDGSFKVSLRSQAGVDVQKIARDFGGGGHRKAAGATVRGLEADRLRKEIRRRVAAALEIPDGEGGL